MKDQLGKLVLILFSLIPIGLTVYFYFYEETSFGMALGQAFLLTFFCFSILNFVGFSIYFIINSFNKDSSISIKEESQDGVIGFALPIVILPVGGFIIFHLDFISSDLKVNISLWSLFFYTIIFIGYVIYRTINDPMVNYHKTINQLLLFLGIVVFIGLIAALIFVLT